MPTGSSPMASGRRSCRTRSRRRTSHGTMAGKLKGREPGRHPEGLADLVDVDAVDLLAELALQQVRDAGRELEVLQAARHFAQRVRRDLAVLRGSGAPRSPHGAHRPGSGCGTGSRCARRGVARHSGNAALAAATAASTSSTDASHLAREPPGGRVVDRSASPGRAGDPLAADPVIDPRQVASSRGGGLRRLCRCGHGSRVRPPVSAWLSAARRRGPDAEPVRTVTAMA